MPSVRPDRCLRTGRPAPPEREPDLAAVLGPVMKQVTPLAQRPHVAVPPAAVAGVVVEMRRRQHHLGRPHRLQLGRGRGGDRTRGRRLSDQQAYSKVTAHTQAAFGQAVNPQLFRNAAGMTIVHDRPEQVRLAAPLLGHEAVKRHQEQSLWRHEELSG